MKNAWKVTVWGVRGSMPMASAPFLGYGGNTACISVDRGEGGIVVFDAGSGLMGLGDSLADRLMAGSGQERAEGRERLVHILLSHLHMDHVMGFFGFRLFHEKGTRIHIYGQGSGGSLKGQLETMFGPPYWPLGLADLRADIQIHEIGPGDHFYLEEDGVEKGAELARIRTFRGNHPGQSLLYRLEQGEKSIVHALDCELDRGTEDGLEAFARHSDLLIWDGTFTKEELGVRKGWGHSCWEQGIGMRQAAAAGKVLVTHYSSGYTDRFLEEQERLARAEDGACHFAREGMELWI